VFDFLRAACERANDPPFRFYGVGIVSNEGDVRNIFQKESHSDIVILLLLEWRCYCHSVYFSGIVCNEVLFVVINYGFDKDLK
jgi:hypothetical protein